jgi:uncharacterized protein YegP (UPF0339 family)
MTIEFFKNRRGTWYFRLKAANGEIVANSEGYKNRADMMKTIGIIKHEAAFAPIVEAPQTKVKVKDKVLTGDSSLGN